MKTHSLQERAYNIESVRRVMACAAVEDDDPNAIFGLLTATIVQLAEILNIDREYLIEELSLVIRSARSVDILISAPEVKQ